MERMTGDLGIMGMSERSCLDRVRPWSWTLLGRRLFHSCNRPVAMQLAAFAFARAEYWDTPTATYSLLLFPASLTSVIFSPERLYCLLRGRPCPRSRTARDRHAYDWPTPQRTRRTRQCPSCVAFPRDKPPRFISGSDPQPPFVRSSVADSAVLRSHARQAAWNRGNKFAAAQSGPHNQLHSPALLHKPQSAHFSTHARSIWPSACKIWTSSIWVSNSTCATLSLSKSNRLYEWNAPELRQQSLTRRGSALSTRTICWRKGWFR